MPILKNLPPNFTLEDLESSFAAAERRLINSKSTASNASLALNYTARYGLQTPMQVFAFLQSLSGKFILQMINDDYAFKKAWELKNKQDADLAFYMAGLLYRRKEVRKKYEKEQQQQYSLEIQNAKRRKVQLENIQLSPSDAAAYLFSIQSLEKSLEKELLTANLLETKIEAWKKHKDQIDLKYTIIEDNLNKLEEFYFSNYYHTNDLEELNIQFEEKVNSLQDEITSIDTKIEAQIANKEAKEDHLFHRRSGLSIQLDYLKELLSLNNSEDSSLSTLKLTLNPQDIIPLNLQIIKHENKNFLVPTHVLSFNELNSQERLKAERHYIYTAQLLTVRHKVCAREREERQNHRAEGNKLMTALGKTKEKIEILRQQISELTLVYNACTFNNEGTPQKNKKINPIPAPQPFSKILPSPSPTQNYKDIVNHMRKAPPLPNRNWFNSLMSVLQPNSPPEIEPPKVSTNFSSKYVTQLVNATIRTEPTTSPPASPFNITLKPR